MNAILLNLYRVRHYLGFAGLAGLAVAISGLAIYLFAALPAEQQAQSKTEQLRHIRTQPVSSGVTAPPRGGDAAALAAFYGQFPLMHDLPDLLKTLHVLAQKNEITPGRGDFKFGSVEGDKLLRYEITLPVTCSYPQLLNFIDAAARGLPTMGLSEISLKREAIGDNLVQAKLNFILYLSNQ